MGYIQQANAHFDHRENNPTLFLSLFVDFAVYLTEPLCVSATKRDLLAVLVGHCTWEQYRLSTSKSRKGGAQNRKGMTNSGMRFRL